jgi:hypothetical protein
MIHPLPPDQLYYRVTTIGRRWPDVLSGRGALYLSATGNRYNTVLQQAAYVCDDLTARWRLRIEFLDLNGNPVTPGSPRVDWSRPRFQLLASPGGGPPPAPPAPYALGNWYPAHVNHL